MMMMMMMQHMYKVLEVSLTAKCSPGISTASGINSHRTVHYHWQVGYHSINHFQLFKCPIHSYKQFYFEQFSLASGCSLNAKTVLFQAIQFCVSRQFSTIWLIDTLSGPTPRAKVDLGAMTMKGYPAFSKTPALLEPHHQIF